MQLDDLQAELRQRNPWEAIDLGFAMARRWWVPLVKAWCVTVLPVGVLIAAGLHTRPVLAVLLLWWLKPLWGRVPRFVLSRALFGATPTMTAVLTAKLWRKGIIGALTWRRPDPLRAFLDPIGDLEGLTGQARRRRRAVLGQRGSGPAIALTLIALLMELSAMLGLAGLVLMMIPDGPQWSAEVLLDQIRSADPPAWLSAVMPGVYLAAVSLIEPLVVAGGFGLYINRRTALEGWDIELVFRRLARRLAPAVLALVALVGLSAPAHAGPAPEAALERVMAQEEFQPVVVQQRWQYRYEWPPPWLELDPETQKVLPFLGESIRVVAYGVLVIALAALLYLILRHIRLPRGARRRDDAPGILRGGVLAALEVPLPPDIARRAWSLWCEGRLPEAISLLYRGALSDLIRVGLRIEEGATEGDCLRQARRARDRGQIDAAALAYFSELTRHWVSLAYARRPPSPQQAEVLCTTWGQHFSSPEAQP